MTGNPTKSGRHVRPPKRFVHEDSQSYFKPAKQETPKTSTTDPEKKKMSKAEKEAIKARVRRSFEKNNRDNNDDTVDSTEDGIGGDGFSKDDISGADFVSGLDGDFVTDDVTELTEEATDEDFIERLRPTGTLLKSLTSALWLLLCSVMWPIFADLAAEILLVFVHSSISLGLAMVGHWAKFTITIFSGFSHFGWGLFRASCDFVFFQMKELLGTLIGNKSMDDTIL